MYLDVHTHINAGMHVLAQRCKHYTDTHTHIDVHDHIHKGRHTHMHMQICKCTCTRVHMSRNDRPKDRNSYWEERTGPHIFRNAVHLASGFAFDFNFHTISYDIKAILLQVPQTQVFSSSSDSTFPFPLGPLANSVSLLARFHVGSMGKQRRQQSPLPPLQPALFTCVHAA
jgi:hypothetical protein